YTPPPPRESEPRMHTHHMRQQTPQAHMPAPQPREPEPPPSPRVPDGFIMGVKPIRAMTPGSGQPQYESYPPQHSPMQAYSSGYAQPNAYAQPSYPQQQQQRYAYQPQP